MHNDVKGLAVYGQKAVGSKFYYDVKIPTPISAWLLYPKLQHKVTQTTVPDPKKAAEKEKRKQKQTTTATDTFIQRVQPVSVFAAVPAVAGRTGFHANETICSHRKK